MFGGSCSKALSCKHERLFDLLTLASFYYKRGYFFVHTENHFWQGAVLSIGVCVFITWFSRDVDRTTIFFNLGFLALMLCMILAASLTGMRRLMQITRSLRRATGAIRDRQGASETTPLFENAFLDDCYQQFCSMRRNHPESACDIQNFLNEDAIENYVHRSVLEGVSDILTSLGILGTFVGLVMGLREFDPSGYEQMTGSVTPLINGIKVAFITSIYGIALSLSFSFNLRSEFSGLSSALDAFLDAFYQYVQPPYEVDSLSKLMAQQKDQEALVHDLTGIFVEQMAQSFEQSITPAFTKMTDSFSQVTETLLQSQEELLTNVCTTVARQMRHELESNSSRSTSSSQSLANLSPDIRTSWTGRWTEWSVRSTP